MSPVSLQDTLTPVAMAAIGLMLGSAGNYVADVRIKDGLPYLLPCQSFEVAGNDPDPDRWAYELCYQVPSGQVLQHRPATSVIHAMINPSPAQPWRGRPPVVMAGLSGEYAAQLDRGLRDDASTKVMHLVPCRTVCQRRGSPMLGTRFKQSRGNVKLVESVAADGWGQGRLAAPPKDWHSVAASAHRYSRPACTPARRSGRRYARHLELHAGMFLQDGTTAREAQRQAYLNTVIPMSDMLARTLSDAFGETVSFTFDRAMYRRHQSTRPSIQGVYRCWHSAC